MTTNHQDETIKLLRMVCTHLKGHWFYNDIKTREFIKNGQNGCAWLDNHKGIFIRLSSAYRKELPQLSLCFEQLNYRHLYVFHSIGCSFKKSPKAIASDIKNRLLSHYDDALNKRNSMRNEHQKNLASNVLRKNIIHSISQIMPLENRYHGRGNEYEIRNVGNLEHRLNDDEKFSLSIRTLNAEQLIKIYQIMTKN
ncbi:hypothetical protein [uncultured Shewanella sp.]|uniref:hypothetical protein n=1 Tax=uncultured Shewanella sp. TaxID=173975 RepID=UPI00260DC25B|nr:hypothetical protein [uncultured Shewanella sp.]